MVLEKVCAFLTAARGQYPMFSRIVLRYQTKTITILKEFLALGNRLFLRFYLVVNGIKWKG